MAQKLTDVSACQNVIGQFDITGDVFQNGLVFKPFADVMKRGSISLEYPKDAVFGLMGVLTKARILTWVMMVS